MNKRILLVKPPFYRLMGSHFNGLDLGLGYIASVLKDSGFETRIYNADYLEKSDFISLEDIFNNYKAYKEILNNEDDPIWEEIEEKISKFNPDILGLSVFTGSFKSAKMVAKIAKRINPNIKIIIGGPQATLSPEKTLEASEFDYLIKGEGEYAFLDIAMRKPLKDIKGLSYKDNGKIIHNPQGEFICNLDSLPFPARDLFLEKGRYMNLGNIITGRGCPFSCKFCASPKIWNRRVRYRSIENIIKELKEIVEKYNQKEVSFVDDTFSLDKERTKELCRKIIDAELDIRWRCDSRADRLDEETIMLMKKAGCICIRMGVESGSERVLKLMQKNEKKEDIKRAADLIRKHGISLTAYFIAGFPGETNEDLKETIEFAKELQADYYSLGIFAPYYGTETYEQLKGEGKIKEEDWEYFFHQSTEGIENRGIDKKLLEEFLSLNKLYGKGKRI